MKNGPTSQFFDQFHIFIIIILVHLIKVKVFLEDEVILNLETGSTGQRDEAWGGQTYRSDGIRKVYDPRGQFWFVEILIILFGSYCFLGHWLSNGSTFWLIDGLIG